LEWPSPPQRPVASGLVGRSLLVAGVLVEIDL
jgi:hypothetical protein